MSRRDRAAGDEAVRAVAVGQAAPALRGQPVFGLPFELERQRARGPVVVAFWGALSSAATLDNLARLTALWPRVDELAGGMVAVTRSPLEAARDFVPRHHVLFPVLVDATGELAGQWGVGGARGLKAAWAKAQPRVLRRAVSVLRNGQPLPEAHEAQLPAAFVVDRTGTVRLAWYGRSMGDRIDTDALGQAACPG